MDKKSSIWAIFIAFSMLFMIIPSSISAGEITGTIIAEETVRNSHEQEVKRVAILPDTFTCADVNVLSSTPAEYQFFTYDGTAEGSAVNRNEGDDRPVFVGNVDNFHYSFRQDLKKIRYLTIKNSTPNQFGEHKVSVSTYIAGKVGMGKSIEITPKQQRAEVHLEVNKLGVISLIFNSDGARLERIRDPDGNSVSIHESLNYTLDGGMKKALFISGKIGVYIGYFNMTGESITLKLESEKTKAYKLGEVIKFKESEPNVGNLPTYSNSEVEIYEFNVEAGQALKIYFKTITGFQSVSYSFRWGIPQYFGDIPIFDKTGIEFHFLVPEEGPFYLTIKRDLPNIGNPEADSYEFALSNINIENFPLDSSKRIVVQPSGDGSIRMFKIDVTNSGTLLFNHSFIQNDPDVKYATLPSRFLLYLKNGIRDSLEPILYTPEGQDHCYYHVQPGSYFFAVESSTTSGEGIVDMQVRYFADAEINLAALNQNQTSLNADQMQSFTLTNLRNDTGQYDAMALKVFKFTMPVCLATTLTVNITGADNSQVFNNNTRLSILYKGSMFYNSPYDEIYAVSPGVYTDFSHVLAINSSEYNCKSFNLPFFNQEERTFYLSLALCRIYDFINTSHRIEEDIVVNLGIGHRNSEYVFKDYDMSANIATNATNAIDFTRYGGTASVNGSLIKGVVWNVTGAKQFDWIQINSQRINGLASNYRIKVYYNAPWTMSSAGPFWLDYTFPESSSVDRTVEIGALTTSFYVYIEINATDPAENVVNNFWVGGYDIPFINPRVDLPEIGPEWAKIGSIIVVVIVVCTTGTIVVILYRNKKRKIKVDEQKQNDPSNSLF